MAEKPAIDGRNEVDRFWRSSLAGDREAVITRGVSTPCTLVVTGTLATVKRDGKRRRSRPWHVFR